MIMHLVFVFDESGEEMDDDELYYFLNLMAV